MAIVEIAGRELRETHERTVAITVDGAPFMEIQASPYDLRELAAGALYADGRICGAADIAGIACDAAACTVDVRLSAEARSLPPDTGQRLRGSSGGYLPLADERPDGGDPAVFNPDDLLCQMEVLCTQSPHRNAGECVHGCGIGAMGSQTLLSAREDIGRHNAMDKAIGAALLEGVSLADKALFITGRISAEMALKASHAGCPLLVSRKSATDDAVERAERLGITLASHCRDGRLRILTHPQRIVLR